MAQYGIARKVVTGTGTPPTADCDAANEVGNVYARTNGGAAYRTFYVCGNISATTYGWELYGLNDAAGSVNNGSAGSIGIYQTTGNTISALSTGAGILDWLTTPSSALLRTALTDETGTGSAVFNTSPTLVTPALGTPSAIVLTNATGLPAASIVGQFATNAQTSTYQVLAADFTACKTIIVASGTFTITLVASGSQPASGACITVLNYGTGVVTLARSGQNINGAAANLTGTAGSATAPTGWRVYSNGTDYVAEVIGGGGSGVAASTVQAGTLLYVRSTTGNDAYTGSVTPALTVYTTGMCLVLNADTANTGSATINVNSLGTKLILNRAGWSLADGDITADKPITMCYDGLSFIIQGDGGSGSNPTAGTGISVVGSEVSIDTAYTMSRQIAQAGTTTYCRSTTGNDTYTCALTPTLTAYTTGSCLVLNADTDNTGAATINVDALGAKSILIRGAGALATGDLAANVPATICYDGTNFITPISRIAVGSGLSLATSITGDTLNTAPEVLTLTNTAIVTNKTISEADNIITLSQLLTFTAANCQGTSAFTSFATPTANAPAAACVTGTNTNYGTLAFDDSTDESVQYHFPLASDWTGNIDLAFRWRAAATSGDVIWAVQTACVADGETGDPSFNTASTVTDTAKGTTLQFNDASISAITVTGCATGEELMFKLYRDADAGGDTMTGDAQLIWARFTTRRAQ